MKLVEFYSPENCRNDGNPDRCLMYEDSYIDCPCDNFEAIMSHRDLQDQLESALEDMNQDDIHNGMER
jgi:hypothetical protein